MAQKQQRWYEVAEDGVTIRIYNKPKPELATSVSIVGKADLAYYRRTFKLSQIDLGITFSVRWALSDAEKPR